MDKNQDGLRYQKMYLGLFGAVTEALEALERQNYGVAAECLRQGQRKSEEIFISEEGESHV